MRYTSDKFQIQLVSKPNSSFNNNLSNQNTNFPVVNFQNSIPEKVRCIKTAATGRTSVQNQPRLVRKSIEKKVFFQRQRKQSLGRAQSLKQQKNDRYKSWLNQQAITTSLKQKQYRIFKQKCIDLLSKKKSTSQVERRVDNFGSHRQKVFIGQNLSQLTDENHRSVEQMMNNIIQKFKTNNKKTYKNHKQIVINKGQSELDPEAEQLMTLRNELPQSHNSDQNKEVRMQSCKSSQVKKATTGSVKNKSHDIFRKLRVDEHQMYKLQQKPNEHNTKQKEISIYKLLDPNLNLLTCTSLALHEASRQVVKTIRVDHIKLSPYQCIAKCPSNLPKSKKVNLNKPLIARKVMKFTKNSADEQYNKKIKNYLDFLFKINFSNQIYVSLQLSSLDDTISLNRSKYKVYVGPGNNSLLIKSLLKRREWIEVVDNIKDKGIQFYWTQNKINQFHQKQQNCISKQRQQITKKPIFKKRSSTARVLSQMKDQNSKILPLNRCEQVQNYIFGEGFDIPFDQQYEVSTVTNHIPFNNVIGSKKNLFKSMFSYYTNVLNKDPFTVIPKTYHIRSIEDPQFKRFVKQNIKEPEKLWIIKPGENTNRGNGIRLSPFSKIEALIKQKIRHPNGQLMTYILQSYIDRPFLYNGRKFDIRHYMLITSVNGLIKAYWYRDGYIRTSSQLYDMSDPDNEFIHLTNDAIQQHSQSYGKYQNANKLSYTQFQRYLDYSYPGRSLSFESIIKQMRQVMGDVVRANYLHLDRDRRRDNFQLFGFDFMVDREFKPYLIQINFNPCLVVNCNILTRIIPPLIQNTLRVGLDPLLPPKSHLSVNKRHTLSENYLRNLRYELIFDESVIKDDILHSPQLEDSQNEEQQQYGDNGKEVPDNFTF